MNVLFFRVSAGKEGNQFWFPSFFVFNSEGVLVEKTPDLYKLIAKQARYERSRATLPAYLRGDIPERKTQPRYTYSDPTARKAASNADRKRKTT